MQSNFTSTNSIIKCVSLQKLVAVGMGSNPANPVKTSPDVPSSLPPDYHSDISAAKLDENPKASNPSSPVVENSVPETRPKILVRFRANNNNDKNSKLSDGDVAATDKKQDSPASDGGGCNNYKRPRREIKKPTYHYEVAGASQKERKKLQGVRIVLTRAEIEKDILAMTIGMEGRRIQRAMMTKKRPAKAVQEELDSLFPGLLLPYINVGKYANRRNCLTKA